MKVLTDVSPTCDTALPEDGFGITDWSVAATALFWTYAERFKEAGIWHECTPEEGASHVLSARTGKKRHHGPQRT